MQLNEVTPYNPNDFTLETYRKVLLLAKHNFTFSDYSQQHERTIYWRHDVDFSLDEALKIAKIENEMAIKATYFLLLHSSYYNLLDNSSRDLVNKIIGLGHSIGLHFDNNYHVINSISELDQWLAFERNILEQLFNCPVRVFSFHNPNSYAMTLEENKYAGMLNTYSHYFKKKVQYCSDSNGYWRYRSLVDSLNDENIKHLQVLTHPIWWTDEALMPREKIINYAKRRQKTTIASYDYILEKNKRVNLS